MIKRLFILILSLTLPILLLGVSVFSFSGMPETYAGRDIYGIGMGDTGVGNLLRANNSAKNASLSCQNLYATFATGIYFGNVNIKDKNSDTSFNGEISYLPYFSLSVPIYKNRIGISYQAIANGKFTAEDFNMNDSDISEIRKADNSIYQVDLFYAYKFEKLNIGLAINYFFGHRTEYTRADLGDPNLINPKYEVEESYMSPGFTMRF
ncbi:MAG: hypothetical protein PHF36_01150, partial [Candidatus Cloacimonetes bacterium]|nr:hypothetical protein [Candidatus Cloacimonadota bacterium]